MSAKKHGKQDPSARTRIDFHDPAIEHEISTGKRVYTTKTAVLDGRSVAVGVTSDGIEPTLVILRFVRTLDDKRESVLKFCISTEAAAALRELLPDFRVVVAYNQEEAPKQP